jgi:hypothetical protein
MLAEETKAGLLIEPSVSPSLVRPGYFLILRILKFYSPVSLMTSYDVTGSIDPIFGCHSFFKKRFILSLSPSYNIYHLDII